MSITPGPGAPAVWVPQTSIAKLSGTIVSVAVTESESFGGLSNLVGIVRLNNERLFIVSSG